MAKSKSKKIPKSKKQISELIALSRVTRYPVSALIERALEIFLITEAPVLASMSLGALKRKAATVSDSDIELWTPLWMVLQDGYDEAFGDEGGAPEDGDPGSLHDVFEGIAKEAGVSLFYTLRAALYLFSDEHNEHSDKFVADPHNLKYRVPTQEEEEALREVRAKHPGLSRKPGWRPEDDPLFHEIFRQRMNDAINNLDAGIQ